MFVTQAAGGASGGGGSSERGMATSTAPAAGSTATRHWFVQAGGIRVRVKKMSNASPAMDVPVGQAAESATPFVSAAKPVTARPVSGADIDIGINMEFEASDCVALPAER
ncbi:MAG: hypothetical protein BWX70_02602 [Verrucomicrobia bacterium ADurb.Bin070]|nr:MAG: hypothetical protein BWX70_02602 [Verrucomicrobia bacterium ADurb.Bin070]